MQMIVYLSHLICAVLFFSMFPNNTFLLGIFYLLCLIPIVHTNTVYYITERKHPPWNIIMKYLIHVSIYENYVQKINLLFMWVVIYMWNDIIFLVEHAEKRLMKIDDILCDNNQRIAHLYYDLYNDDTINRFHHNLFNTNRLYLFDRTEYSRPVTLGVSNYRKMLKENKKPRELKKHEKKWHHAAHGKNIFISDRNFVIFIPALCILTLSGYIDFTGELRMYLSFVIFFLEVIGKLLLSKKTFYIVSNLTLTIIVFFSSQYISIYFIDNVQNEQAM